MGVTKFLLNLLNKIGGITSKKNPLKCLFIGNFT